MTKTRKTQEGTLGRDAVRLSLSKIITLTITMITTMMLSRFRTLEEYGTYSQLLLVINLFSSIFMLGLPNSINYFLARAETQEEKQKFLSVYYSLSTLLSIIMGLALVLSVPIIEQYFRNPMLRGFVYFLAVYPWTSVVSSSIENVLIVYKRTSFLMIYRVVHSVALLASVWIIQLIGLGFKEYMICFLVVNAFFTISVYVISSRLSGGISPCFDKELIKSIFIFSIPLGLAGIVGTLDIEIDKLLIGRLMDTSQMAIYANASKELPVTIISSSITAVLLPQLTKMLKDGRTEDAINLWNIATELSMIFMGIVVAGIFVYAREVIEILYSSKYLGGISVFRVYSVVLLLRVTYFGIILNAIGKTKDILYCSIAALVLNIILNPLFYYMMGMIGPAIATFLSILITQLIQLGLTSRNTGVVFSKVYPWKRCAMIIGINILLAIPFYFIKAYAPIELYIGEIAESIFLGIVWAVCYLIIMRNRIKILWNKLNED